MELESNDNNDDLEQTLMRAIGELPGEQRDALLLQQQGFSLSDIAQITDAAEETVKSRLRYARNQLREQLGGDT
jgi:RNA polymerase sigma-70 factor (ECF subfamily)